MSKVFFRDSSGRGWPTRRMAQWASANGINSLAALDTWLTNNVTTIAQARTVFSEIIRALHETGESGELDT